MICEMNDLHLFIMRLVNIENDRLLKANILCMCKPGFQRTPKLKFASHKSRKKPTQYYFYPLLHCIKTMCFVKKRSRRFQHIFIHRQLLRQQLDIFFVYPFTTRWSLKGPDFGVAVKFKPLNNFNS